MTISQRAQDVRAVFREGKVGEEVFANPLNRITTRTNADPQAYQVTTVTVTGATNSHDYDLVINGVTVTYTSDATASIAEIALGLAAAINVNPLVRGQVSAAYTATTCVVTSNYPGVAFTLTESDGDLTTAATTANDASDPIYFGRLVLEAGSDSDEANDLLCKNCKSTNFTAQVITVDYTYTGTEILYVTVVDKHTGREYSASAISATNKATTTALLVAGLNAVLPANFVLAADAGAGDELLLTAELAGVEFDAYVGMGVGVTSAISVTYTTGPDRDTSLLRAQAGVSLYAYDEEITAVEGDEAYYPGNAGVRVLQKGQVWVENSQTIVAGTPVYVELDGTGDDFGKFFNTNSATRLLLPGCKWVRGGATSTDAIAALDYAA